MAEIAEGNAAGEDEGRELAPHEQGDEGEVRVVRVSSCVILIVRNLIKTHAPTRHRDLKTSL